MSLSLLAECIGLTNRMDEARGRLDPAAKLRYTKLRHRILKQSGEGVTADDILWLSEQLLVTATKGSAA